MIVVKAAYFIIFQSLIPVIVHPIRKILIMMIQLDFHRIMTTVRSVVVVIKVGFYLMVVLGLLMMMQMKKKKITTNVAKANATYQYYS